MVFQPLDIKHIERTSVIHFNMAIMLLLEAQMLSPVAIKILTEEYTYSPKVIALE